MWCLLFPFFRLIQQPTTEFHHGLHPLFFTMHITDNDSKLVKMYVLYMCMNKHTQSWPQSPVSSGKNLDLSESLLNWTHNLSQDWWKSKISTPEYI